MGGAGGGELTPEEVDPWLTGELRAAAAAAGGVDLCLAAYTEATRKGLASKALRCHHCEGWHLDSDAPISKRRSRLCPYCWRKFEVKGVPSAVRSNPLAEPCGRALGAREEGRSGLLGVMVRRVKGKWGELSPCEVCGQRCRSGDSAQCWGCAGNFHPPCLG